MNVCDSRCVSWHTSDFWRTYFGTSWYWFIWIIHFTRSPHLPSRQRRISSCLSSPRIEILLHLMEILLRFACIEVTVVVLFKMKRRLLSSCTFWVLSPVRGGFPFLLQLSMQRRISWVLLPSEMSSDVFLVYPLCSSNCFEEDWSFNSQQYELKWGDAQEAEMSSVSNSLSCKQKTETGTVFYPNCGTFWKATLSTVF